MKRFCHIAIVFLLVSLGAHAQKIDQRLTSLLQNSNVKSRGAYVGMLADTAAVKEFINVDFNSDCSVRNFSAFAMLKEGAACPTEKLQKLGVGIRDMIGRMLILSVPAESLIALDDIDEIESVSADQMNQLMNNVAREKSRVTEVATPEKALAMLPLPLCMKLTTTATTPSDKKKTKTPKA